MSNYVKIAITAPAPPVAENVDDYQKTTEQIIQFWKKQFDTVLPDNPDLIVTPECCDRPENLPKENRLEYYRARGSQVAEFFAETARENNCYTLYSAIRQIEDGSWRNSSIISDRKGNIAGIYDKNHPVVEETTEADVLPGKDAPLIECDFGRVACAICFDLNFAQLREKYVQAKPDLILFSSVYHGGDIVQSNWAYSCRSYFIGAVSGLPSQIRNPFGEVLASTTNYFPFTVKTINLDFCLAHLDYNWEKLSALKEKYGEDVEIYDPGYIGSVLITSNIDKSAVELAKEFEIELLDEYFTRALDFHNKKRAK